MAGSVQDIDRGWSDIKENIAKLADRELIVGIRADAQYKDGRPVAEVAELIEYGSDGGKVPMRSFLRATIDSERSRIDATIRRAENLVLIHSASAPVILGELGQLLVQRIRSKMRQLDVYDTHTMHDSITAEVL